MQWRFLYRGLKTRYRDQRAELGALLAALSPEQIAVDVGANKGGYLWALSRAVPRGRVVAFEPQPVLADYLRQACRSAGLRNVVIEAAGVSARSGKLLLAVPGGGASSPGASFEPAVAERESCRTIEVATVSLDDYFADEKSKIGAIKIDVEGHELSVLKGAVRLIAAHRPTILCECEQRHLSEGSVGAVLDFVRAQNYDGFFIDRSRLRPLSEFDPAIHQKQDGERFWDAAHYCNNFIFKPRPDK
jgi:FkbM family methyltransferase